MSDLYRNRYRTASASLQNWNYSWPGMYFITICTADREHYFGEIKNGIMHLSPAGAIANVLWYEIKNHTKNVDLGEYVVMPNHVHGILILNDIGSTEQSPIGTQRFQNQGKRTISSIVGGYKSAVTKHCNRLGLEFKWQSRFYDHIIRDEPSFHRISQYIVNNPANWSEDRFF